jgi:protein O-mannosyl-transferase
MWFPCLLLIAATVVAYWPALHGDFLWDDDSHISTNDSLRSLTGLRDIWLKPGATLQYYPLTFTLFWVGYHLWALNTFGYHLLTLSMHCITAVLLWQVLVRLRVHGAFLAGAIFALHPVCVMSVAWMAELKNTLSGALALTTAWTYLRFAGLGVYDPGDGSKQEAARIDWRLYVLALVLFQLALLAKTAVSFLPLTLFLIVWWQRDRLQWRDLWPLFPMLGMAVAMGQVTSYVEQHSGGASGSEFNIGFLERVLISGRSFWFYLGKIFFPHELTFIYPRWQVNTGAWWQYVYPVATVGLLWGLWKARRRFGKAPFVAMLHFYVGTSFLILILVLYMTRYSFVSDHWQYFGCMSVMALAAAGISMVLGRFEGTSPFLKPVFCGTLLLVLGALTWRQCGTYADLETFWRTTLAENPDCWMAHISLGSLLRKQGHMEEAIEHYHQALEREPNSWEALNDLGAALADGGQYEEAIGYYRKAIEIDPNRFLVQKNLGHALAAEGRYAEAIECYQKAIQTNPDYSDALNDLGAALAAQGRFVDAIECHHKAIQIDPDFPEALNNLALILATSSDDKLRNGPEAVRLAQRACELTDYRKPLFIATLAAAYAESKRFPEAVTMAEKAEQLATDAGLKEMADAYRQLLELFQAGRPYHEPGPMEQ